MKNIYIDNYFKTCNTSLLEWKDEKEKFIKYYVTKDENLKKELINDNLRLISYCLREKFKSSKFDYNELVSYGYEGLVHAIENFNPYNDHKFSSYAIICIYGYIIKGMYDINGLPQNVFEAYLHEKKELEKQNRIFASEDEEMYEALRKVNERKIISKESIDYYYTLFKKKINLDEIIEDNNATYNNDDNILIDKIMSNGIKEDINEELDSNSDGIMKKKLDITKYRYGILDGQFHTIKDTEDMFNISKTRIHEIENYVIFRLNKRKKSLKELKEYLTLNNGETNLSHKI